MRSTRKPRTEWIYGTTAAEVEEIGIEMVGSDVGFMQDMVSTYAETTYERGSKGPKTVTRIPTTGPYHSFPSDRTLDAYDYVVAVDTGWKPIGKEKVSVTTFLEAEWIWIGFPGGLERLICLKPPHCFAFLGVEQKSSEPIGWLFALEKIRAEPRCKDAKRVALIIDSQLDNLMGFNNRQLPIYRNRYLPDNVTMIHASQKGEYFQNFLINQVDRVCKKGMDTIQERQVSPWKGFRKIPLNITPSELKGRPTL